MSLEPKHTLQTFSPTSSGRSSPSPRIPRKTTEEALYKKDKHFRRYASGVDRALSLWDTAQQEWADYISFLARLLKAIQAHPSDIPIVPQSHTVATRLAQCLNPTLPSGVHQKALEVYSYIFSIIGKDALSRDLYLYLPGLASVLSFASLTVRPLFLSLLEDHILKLDAQGLRPALKAIVLSLLPGLEDETSEDFERMVQALDRLRKAVSLSPESNNEDKSQSGASHFWQCFFLATITNASRRQGALAFLVRRLSKFGAPRRDNYESTANPDHSERLSKEAEAAVSPEPGLLIRCFEAGLMDTQLLIQRGFLDLLVSHLPLDSPVLQQRINKDDLERLVAAAVSVVSRRDMSLNRRLWAWLLGPEPSAVAEGGDGMASPAQDSKNPPMDPSSQHAAYFSRFGSRALTRSVMKMINWDSRLPSERARPFRICLSLMDRWEVGGLIVPEIFLPALESVHSYSRTASKEELDEVMRSANIFFDGVESGLIWGKILHLVTSASSSVTSNGEEALRNMKLARFILGRFNLKEDEMVVHHMPVLVLAMLASLNESSRPSMGIEKSGEKDELAYEIIESLAQLIPERAFKSGPEDSEASTSARDRKEITARINAFYTESHGSLDLADPPFTPKELGQLVLREAGYLYTMSIQSQSERSAAEACSRIFSTVIPKVQALNVLDELGLLAKFQQFFPRSTSTSAKLLPFPQLASIVTVLSALQTSQPVSYVDAAELHILTQSLVAEFWSYLSPFLPKYHVEAVRYLWQLHAISASTRLVEAGITSLVARQVSGSRPVKPTTHVDQARRFTVLWTHTMNEQSVQAEKRSGSISRRASGLNLSSISPLTGGYQSMLTRPLMLLLDVLTEEGSESFFFIKGWLQDLPTLNKVFEILSTHVLGLQCLASQDTLSPSAPGNESHVSVDDSKECSYYLKHLLNILRWPSQYTWMTLAEDTVPQTSASLNAEAMTTVQQWLVRTCLKTLSLDSRDRIHVEEVHRTSVAIICQIYQSPLSTPLKELEMEVPLMARLRSSDPSLQSLLLEAILAALKLRLVSTPQPQTPPGHQRKPSRDTGILPRLSLTTDRANMEEEGPSPIPPPPQLVECLRFGFSSSSSRLVLDDWVKFLVEVLPLFTDTIFQNLLPLVECFCTQINQVFGQLRSTFQHSRADKTVPPESTLITLMNGLEQILARGHVRLVMQETHTTAGKSPEQPQGFFGNMVSGVFASEGNQTRAPTANSRLTVLLCFQDTVRICFSIWSWGGYGSKNGKQDQTSIASFAYTSLRMRNRARRILEHLFAAEALECLETLIVLWCKSPKEDDEGASIMSLLNVLNGAKPKHTIPAIFNAVYSRTNPNALDPTRMSTLTSDLSDTELTSFLVDYTTSLEDDAMDEIWPDCTLFLRDVLGNPLPHRQILPSLLEFTSVIGRKVDNTNFGEQKRMRRELSDIFARLLTAIFTTRSMGFLQDPAQATATEKLSAITNGAWGQRRVTDVVAILTTIIPNLPLILVENDRVANTATSISTSVIGPTFHAKAFPENVSKPMLDLFHQLTRVAASNKAWKKDLADAFNDPRFFNTSLSLLISSWMPILAQWTLTDKDRLPDLLSRLSAPTTAGIMFGVGATSARQEADKKTQHTLRRIALLLLAAPEDTFTPLLPSITEKVVELLTATPASSPSSSTRSEVFMLLRAIVLKTSLIHLASFWPIINQELSSALSSLLPDADNKDTYTNTGILQACKLLDQLVVLDPDDFQLLEWLFIADTIDAVYKPSDWYPTSLADEIAEVLSSSETPTSRPPPSSQAFGQQVDSSSSAPKRSLFIDPLIDAVEKEEDANIKDMARRELVDRVLRPFLGQLSMVAFEARYSMGAADWEGCWKSCVKDVHRVE